MSRSDREKPTRRRAVMKMNYLSSRQSPKPLKDCRVHEGRPYRIEQSPTPPQIGPAVWFIRQWVIDKRHGEYDVHARIKSTADRSGPFATEKDAEMEITRSMACVEANEDAEQIARYAASIVKRKATVNSRKTNWMKSQ